MIKHILQWLFIILINLDLSIIAAQNKPPVKQEVDYVNSFIGTAERKRGATMPFVCPPFAMTNFTPVTCESFRGRMPYVFEDSVIMGFSGSHKPTVWMGEYGEVTLMPMVDGLKLKPEDRKVVFNHSDEIASPFYYSVKTKAGSNSFMQTEITATEHCGIFRFTFPKSNSAHIVVQAINIDDQPEPFFDPYWNSKNSRLKQTAFISIDTENKEISGYNPDRVVMDLGPPLKNFKGYFVIKFDKDIRTCGTWNNDTIYPYSRELYASKRLGAFISFPSRTNEAVLVKVGTSFISIDQARHNLEQEIPDWDFEKVKQLTRDKWQQSLSKIKIEGSTDDQKTIFYTAYYHCLLFPRMFSEYGKYYSAADDKIHEGVAYNDYSLWDTFRALHPFLIFVEPKRVNDMITSMLQMYREGGWLPMWPNPAETNVMTGTHADAVIADAYIKGIRDYDINLAYEAMRKNAMMPGDRDLPVYRTYDCNWEGFEGRKGSAFYHSIGYLPVDYVTESVSRTLEYGLDDYCIAQVAKDMGKTDDYERLLKWSQNYKNVFNKETGLVAPRLFNGNWYSKTQDGFTEGSPQIYTFSVPHDIPGLIDLIGGKVKFASRLDDFFSKGQYQHDNEPGHHIIYLYNYCGQPWKTQELVYKHIKENYSNKPDGINGNDDCGQMSAWFIFSVMGFYPVTPATGIYALGAPQLPEIKMNYTVQGKPRSFQIVANGLSADNIYVQKVTLDGVKLEKPFITHDQIIQGQKLEFEMGSKPNFNAFKTIK